MRTAVALIPDFRRRIEGNLALVFPERPPADRIRIRQEMADNIGRTLIDMLAKRGFQNRAPWSEPTGAGWPVLQRAAAEGRGAIIVSGHFGHWEGLRGPLEAHGIRCAALYRPVKNPFLNRTYLSDLELLGQPIFPRGAKGFRDLVRHLRMGGIVAVLLDQYVKDGVPISFLGHPAPSGTAMADLALKYSIPLIPGYATRRPDGVHIDVEYEAPITPSTPEAMTQAAADSLSARVRAHPEQYYWLHRRWVKRFTQNSTG
jgi:KDO2-lipid IV(A) lauroyltransferase